MFVRQLWARRKKHKPGKGKEELQKSSRSTLLHWQAGYLWSNIHMSSLISYPVIHFNSRTNMSLLANSEEYVKYWRTKGHSSKKLLFHLLIREGSISLYMTTSFLSEKASTNLEGRGRRFSHARHFPMSGNRVTSISQVVKVCRANCNHFPAYELQNHRESKKRLLLLKHRAVYFPSCCVVHTIDRAKNCERSDIQELGPIFSILML